MTTLDEPPAETGRRLFEYDLDDLAEVGVRLPEEQMALYHYYVGRPMHGFAMTFAFDWDAYHQPVTGWDEAEQQAWPMLWPSIVELNWSKRQDSQSRVVSQTMNREQDWRRFPSIPGNRRLPTELDHYELEAVEAYRIWDLWPIDEELVPIVEAHVVEFISDDEGPYQRYHQWNDWMTNGTACEFAVEHGGLPPSKHKHEHSQWSEACYTGWDLLKEWESDIVVYPPGFDPACDNPCLRWFPGPALPLHLQADWEALLRSSQRNTHRAVRVFPPWGREAGVQRERKQSPWLWLY